MNDTFNYTEVQTDQRHDTDQSVKLKGKEVSELSI